MSILIFVIILIVLVLVHEFGHFIVAKRAGIRVDEFSIGFGPALFSACWGETRYSFRVFLLGGYVKIFGEDPDEASRFGPDSVRSFVNKPKIVQAAVLVAGVLFNILLAWVVFIGIFMAGMPTALSEEDAASGTAENVRLVIAEVLPETPAAQAGLSSGDVIERVESVGGEALTAPTGNTVIDFISTRGGEELTIFYTRGEEARTAVVTPETNIVPENPGRAAIGVSMGLVGDVRHPLHVAVWEGTKFTIDMLGAITVALTDFFAQVFTLSADFSQIAGPVGIATLVGDAAETGVVSLFFFTAFISLNLAIINLLPFPALDGGRLLFVLIEALKGSPIKPVVANALNTLGFALLILLMIAVTYNDIARLFGN